MIVPRNFVLLEELEKTEKGNTDMSTSYGLVQSDDITLSFGAGQSFQYVFDFPADHMPGTLWIHPHHHGSTTLPRCH